MKLKKAFRLFQPPMLLSVKSFGWTLYIRTMAHIISIYFLKNLVRGNNVDLL